MRLVKTIGDAAMLVSSDTDALLSMLLDLADAADADGSGLPAIHAGVARGPALNRGGDVYGSAVNQASRIAEFARAGSVVASEDVKNAAQGEYRWSFAGRRRLKGLAEQASLYRVRRPPEPDGPSSAYAGVDARSPSPAAWRSVSALSVFSQVKSWSSRPKWP